MSTLTSSSTSSIFNGRRHQEATKTVSNTVFSILVKRNLYLSRLVEVRTFLS